MHVCRSFAGERLILEYFQSVDVLTFAISNVSEKA